MSFSPRRIKLPAELLQGAPSWARALADVVDRNTEGMARGVEVAQSGSPGTQSGTVTTPLAQPLVLGQAVGASALWVGRCETQAGAPVLAPAVSWAPTRGGAKVLAVSGDAGTYRVTFAWV